MFEGRSCKNVVMFIAVLLVNPAYGALHLSRNLQGSIFVR